MSVFLFNQRHKKSISNKCYQMERNKQTLVFFILLNHTHESQKASVKWFSKKAITADIFLIWFHVYPFAIIWLVLKSGNHCETTQSDKFFLKDNIIEMAK